MSGSIQSTVESIEAVRGCHVIEEDGSIEQIYIDADLDTSSEHQRTQAIKSIVRSVLGAVAIHHHIELDYRKIKIVDYKQSDPAPSSCSHPRIHLIAAYQRRFPQEQCIVELHCRGQTCIGQAAISDNLLTAAFSAFQQAFHEFDFGTVRLCFIRALHNDIDQTKVVLLKLEYTQHDNTRNELLGAAEAKEDLILASIKAMLMALNRRLTVQEPSLDMPTRNLT